MYWQEEPVDQPEYAICWGHMVILCDQYTGSDGEAILKDSAASAW
jgi:hypothetical protein